MFHLFSILSLSTSALAVDYAAFRAQLSAESGWADVERKKLPDVGEVLVRHKQILGVDCLEGSTAAALPADDLLAAASDIPNQPSWSSWAVKRSVKLTGGSTGFDYYQLLDNPYPINDRYWFVRATITRRGEDRVFMWEGIDPTTTYASTVADIIQSFPGAVITGVNVGDWTFTPAGDQTTIRYRICTDVGGSIPAWAGEFAARTTLPTNLSDLIREVRRRLGR